MKNGVPPCLAATSLLFHMAFAGMAQAATSAPSVQTLRDAYRDVFLVGTAVDSDVLKGRSPQALEIATKHFAAITAGNSLKPSSVQAQEGKFTFDEGDRLVDLAERAEAVPIGHVLVWHEQSPDWFFEGKNGGTVTRELALQRLRDHIKTVVGRYRGRIKEWDVVNEAINDGPGLLRDTPWLRAIGEDYIAEAFHAAHEADPDALLIYNDYNIERPYKRPKAIELLKSLLAQNVPVHAVGIQGHWRLDSPDLPEIDEAISEFSSLGLKVMITELDIGVLPTQYEGANIAHREKMTPEQRGEMDPYTAGLPEAVEKRHADRYRELFKVFLRHKESIGRVTFWGTHDGDSWLNNFPVLGRTEYPLLFDRQFKPKAAYFSLLELRAQDYSP